MELQNPCNGVGSTMSHPIEGYEKKTELRLLNASDVQSKILMMRN